MVRKRKDSVSCKIIIGLNTAWNLYNFRSGLIRTLVSQNYEVVTFAPADDYVEKVEKLGCRFIAVDMDQRGVNFFSDLLLIFKIFCLFRKEKPDLFLGYTIKPNIYGSIVSRLCGVQYINNVAGLGSVFGNKGWLQKLVKKLYTLAFAKSSMVFFQNSEDLEYFMKVKIVNKVTTGLLPGSGVNLYKYRVVSLPNNKRFRFLLVARILKEKGVEVFVEAAQVLQKEGICADFALLGFLETNNKFEISEYDIQKWVAQKSILYLGESFDVRKEIASADCIVLPSFYREGTPKSLLEAAAMGRPIITTNSIGCRNVVDHGINGYLCHPKDVTDLASKMRMMTLLPRSERTLMGLRGREKIEREFDEQIVINKYLNIIKQIL